MFDFNKANVEINVSKYLVPGNYIVKVTQVESGVSSQKQTPFIKITVADASDATASNEYYLNTVAGPSGKSAMDISAQNIIILVGAANNIDITMEEGKNKVKQNIGSVGTPEELAKKLSSLLIGKEFAIHLNGKWVNPTDIEKESWIKAEFGNGLFAVPKDRITKLKNTPTIKGEKGEKPTLTTKTSTDW